MTLAQAQHALDDARQDLACLRHVDCPELIAAAERYVRRCEAEVEHWRWRPETQAGDDSAGGMVLAAPEAPED